MSLLINGSFEGKRYSPKGVNSVVLPEAWEAGWLNYDEGNKTAKVYHCDAAGAHYVKDYPNKYGPRARPNMKPVLKPEILAISLLDSNGQVYIDPPRIHMGNQAVTGFKLYGTICYWLCQRVPATPGNIYRATAWAHAWARASEDPNDAHYSHGVGKAAFYAEEGDPALNDDTGNYRFRVGIDPFGGGDPFGSAVVWGRGAHIYNTYHSVPSVEAVARADSIMVFLCADNWWGFVNSNSFWDSAELLEVVAPPPPVEPPVNYVVVVNLVLDPTQAEVQQVLERTYKDKQTVVYSADDAKRLVRPGKPGSKVVVWEPERWPGILEWLAPCATETRRYL